MSSLQQPSVVCTHERRPGTTVCLHCRHAALLVARAKFKRLMFRGTAVALVFATFIAAGALSATAIRGKNRRDSQRPQLPDVQVISTADPVIASADGVPPAPAAVAQQGAAKEAGGAPLVPVLSTGETPLGHGVVATRGDSAVLLSFDTPENRTRVPEKFEQFVRTTLPAVYGPDARAILGRVPRGGIARQGSLLYELPLRGVRIAVNDAWNIRLFPETRPGQDGPLVVRYRVSVVPGAQ